MRAEEVATRVRTRDQPSDSNPLDCIESIQSIYPYSAADDAHTAFSSSTYRQPLALPAQMSGHSGEYDHLVKILLVGNPAVGKSSLLLRFTEGAFEEDTPATVGVDFKLKFVNVGSKIVKATIVSALHSTVLLRQLRACSSARLTPTVELQWDTAGQERYRTLTSSYYRGGHGVILVYDTTRPDTFAAIQQWLNEVDAYAPGGGKNVVKLLVGNKSDLASERAVTTADGESLARSKGMLFLETSARSGDNVKQAFEEVCAKILDSPALLANTQGPSRSNVRLDAPRPPAPEASGSGACCS